MKKILRSIGNFFLDFFKSIYKVLKKIGISIANFFKKIFTYFIKGSIWTKLSFFIFGIGNVSRGQVIKGILLFLVQVVLLIFFISSPTVNGTPFGFKALKNIFTLGSYDGTTWETGFNSISGQYDIFIKTPADNSLLMLLFGIISFFVLALYLVIWHANIKGSYEVDKLKKENKRIPKFKESLRSLANEKFHTALLVVPIIGVLIFSVLPIVFMIFLAFTSYDKNTDANGLFSWVGFKVFIELFRVEGLRNSFGSVLVWTLIWAICATFSNYYLGIMLAVLINKKEVRLKKLWRTIFILTIALPQFVSLLVVGMLLDVKGPFGKILPFEILTNETNVWIPRIAIIIINLWIGVPYTMLLTTGILMNIPKDLYEAAS
ncbi:MAG: sugar ABC transporter permease, partial [Acholeplasmatales bacterium]|nr:sugar ABC transporter permease [Acholeplasmatales bacterium]